MDISLGIGMGLVVGGLWETYAHTEIAKIKAANARLKEAKKDGLL